MSVAGVFENSSLACLRVWSMVDSEVRREARGVAVDGEQADVPAPVLAATMIRLGDVAVEHERSSCR